MALMMIFANAQAHYSLDAKLNRVQLFREGRFDGFLLRMLQAQLTLVYLGTFLGKIRHNDWLSGEMLFYVFQDKEMIRLPLSFLGQGALKFLTYLTLVIEGAAPLALWFRKTRGVALIVLFAFHLGLELTMNILFFQWLMIASLTLFISESQVDRWILLFQPQKKRAPRDGSV